MSFEVIRESYECPACHQEHPYFKEQIDQLKAEGRLPADYNFVKEELAGPLFTQQKLNMLPIGATVPGFHFATEICANCGCIYAFKLYTTEGKAGLAPVPPQMKEQLQKGFPGRN